MVSVLVVEDDAVIRASLAEGLRARGHTVLEAATGLVGAQLAVESFPDVVVLDLGLPDIDGADLLRMVRAVSAVPVIVATARDDEHEIVKVLDAGADDYVIKPFSTEQIDARIRAILRRSGGDEPGRDRIRVGELEVDVASRVATVRGEAMNLSRKEFDLLHLLATRNGEVVTKREMVASVWRQPYVGMDKTVDTHLSWLRSKLGESAAQPRYLVTVRGVGVKLVAPE
jgi:DNA-binding response OmpR family regulator